ncbi:MAG TPA: hypothetical protein VF669_10075 [Tepidisphaeraceae bacterium]|jgi:hypothetical protein
MTIALRWFVVMVIGMGGLCWADGPTTREARLEIAKRLWEERLAKAGGKAIVSEHYPTEEALVFLTAYDFTRDVRYAKQAEVQLEYAHAREKNGLFVTSKGLTTRDYQARQIYNFYLAYRILAEGKYLRWADDGASAMLKLIPREAHTCDGETHTLFLAGYFDSDGKPVESVGNAIDVNQNAEVALAYSLLYHDPASRFFRDAKAKEIAFEELLASMSIQDMKTGLIPLHENIRGGDTAYGAYGAFSWTWCQLMWKDERIDKHVRLAAKWLASRPDLATGSDRFYPTRMTGVMPYWEAYYRLPAYWYAGVDARPFIDALFERIQKPDAVPGDLATAPLYWAYYDLMGVPREFFLEGKVP